MTFRYSAAPKGGALSDCAANTRDSLPVARLRGISRLLRRVLKRDRIVSCAQLLQALGTHKARAAFARRFGIALDDLTALVQRADLARIHGVGAVFGEMLEQLEVRDVQTLAGCDADRLTVRLQRLHLERRTARRAPNRDEVRHWIRQARSLPILVTYLADRPPSPSTSAML